MPTVMVILVVGAFVCRIMEAMGKCPKIVGDLLVCLVLLLMVLPVGKG